MKHLITSESVGFGHPDKAADMISDYLVDLFLSKDPNTRAGIETMVKDNTVVLGGEIKTTANISDEEITNAVKEVVKVFGLSKEHGFNHEQITVINLLGKQSPEISGAVDNGEFIGAGDQGMMLGYATNETPNYMPLAIHISKILVDHTTSIEGFGPDAKSQVTIEEDGDNKRIDTILISTMHKPEISLSEVRKRLVEDIITNNVKLDLPIAQLIDKNTKIVINPAGTWNIGSAVSDCGLTGRKIINDQYGSYCPAGGGAFSGKDSSKVDRSAAYLARYIAKNIVAAGLADKVKIEFAYMIGVAEPVSVSVYTYGTAKKMNEEELSELIYKVFPLTPEGITNHFGLKTPIFYDTARYGHFGRPELPWEQLDKVEELQRYRLTLVEEL